MNLTKPGLCGPEKTQGNRVLNLSDPYKPKCLYIHRGYSMTADPKSPGVCNPGPVEPQFARVLSQEVFRFTLKSAS